MYSVVLAALMTTQGASPAWGHGCWGCHGCHGCCGGYNAFSYGCCGGCWGCCGGCCGGCWGCCGGCWGCWGGCNGCYGCLGGYAVAYAPSMAAPVYAAAPMTQPGQAEIIVQLPADARLYVDGQPVTLKSTARRIVTPRLENGQQYYYTLRAEATRDGKPVRAEKRVTFRAGDVARVNLDDLSGQTAEATAMAPAHLTVRVPSRAQLFVNGTLLNGSGSLRSFDTPALQAGQDYFYTLKAEIQLDGRTKSEIRQVDVAAGRNVSVDFEDLTRVTTASR
jgi:uncharacterized protein (TIGR03000 family)